MPTSTELRDQAAHHDQNARDSFERCDTDGFRSQWASGLLAEEARLQADIQDAGGRAMFPALFDLDGNLVAAKQVDTRHGRAWALLESDDPRAKFTGWFNPSRARRGIDARRNDARKGYYVGYVMARAKADLRGGNACTVRAVSVRTDGGFSRDVEIVDNGRHHQMSSTLGRWYWANDI